MLKSKDVRENDFLRAGISSVKITTKKPDFNIHTGSKKKNMRVRSLAGSLDRMRLKRHQRKGSFNPTISNSRKKFPNFEIRGNDVTPLGSKSTKRHRFTRTMSTITFQNVKSSNVSRLSLK